MKLVPRSKHKRNALAAVPRPRKPAPSAPKRKEPSRPVNRISKKKAQDGQLVTMAGAAAITRARPKPDIAPLVRKARATNPSFRNLDDSLRAGLEQQNALNRAATRHMRRKFIPKLRKMRNQYFSQGRRKPLLGFTWEQYCEHIGIKPDTARDWFERYGLSNQKKQNKGAPGRKKDVKEESTDRSSTEGTEASKPEIKNTDGDHGPDQPDGESDIDALLAVIGDDVDRLFMQITDDQEYATAMSNFMQTIARRHHRSMKIAVTPEVI